MGRELQKPPTQCSDGNQTSYFSSIIKALTSATDGHKTAQLYFTMNFQDHACVH